MAPARQEIFLADGPRGGENVMVDAGPDGGPPREVTLPDPPGSAGEFPISTTYYLMQVEEGPEHPPMYQAVPPGNSL
jgi:hypothetical protein